jgi:transmembrane sensor
MKLPLPAAPPADDVSAEIERLALHWCVRRSAGEPLPAAEEQVFQAWLAADAAHALALQQWQRDWQAIDGLPASGVGRLRRQLDSDLEAESAVQRRRAWARPRAWLVAGLLMACGAGYFGWSLWQQPMFEQQFATVRGQQLDVSLPDGSLLRMDTGSRAEVALYRSRRELRLPDGQLLLQVKGDAARPFEVLAGPLRITVIGTRFAVRYTPGVPGHVGASVAVEEGRVQVSAVGEEGASVLLMAGQQIASDAAGRLGPVGAVAAAGIAPWRERRISFDDTPLAEALAEFERYGPVPLVVNDPAVAVLRLTGTFDPYRIENFARILPKVLPVRVQGRGGRAEIVAGG